MNIKIVCKNLLLRLITSGTVRPSLLKTTDVAIESSLSFTEGPELDR